MALPKCVDAFILAILCGNPVLKGAWIGLLNAMILRLQQESTLYLAQIARINAASRLLSLASNTVRALIDRTKVDLNLFLGPLQQFSSCLPLADLNKILQSAAVNKTFVSLNKLDYKLRRMVSLSEQLTATKEYLDKQIETLQDFLDRINTICP
jgi:hypothetical protein